jgi:chemotaxis family two-component system sensor kinase Cph1
MSVSDECSGHSCVIYDSFNDQKLTVLPFIREGLERGDQCIYVCNEQTDDDWCEELQAYGIDVAAERETGSLTVGRGTRWQQTAAMGSITRAGQAWSMIEQALATHPGVRFAVDYGWTLDSAMSPADICHWEATVNPLIEGHDNIRIMCLYNVNRHPVESIHAALRTHPSVVVGGLTSANPYYEAPRILANEPYLNRSTGDPAAIARMLQQLGGAIAK